MSKRRMKNKAKLDHGKAIIEEQARVPKCPSCGSTKVKRISGTAKVAGAVVFGLLSKTARSQFKCKDCGYMW